MRATKKRVKYPLTGVQCRDTGQQPRIKFKSRSSFIPGATSLVDRKSLELFEHQTRGRSASRTMQQHATTRNNMQQHAFITYQVVSLPLQSWRPTPPHCRTPSAQGPRRRYPTPQQGCETIRDTGKRGEQRGKRIFSVGSARLVGRIMPRFLFKTSIATLIPRTGDSHLLSSISLSRASCVA